MLQNKKQRLAAVTSIMISIFLFAPFGSAIGEEKKDVNAMAAIPDLSEAKAFIDSEEAASKAAKGWLEAVGGDKAGLTIGKIQEVEQIYVVNIVTDDKKNSKLRDLLIIRKPDGFIFPVFPPAMAGHGMMGGMGGMGGMHGMGGMTGGK